jgi:geranylgeranyl diphosphate synthase, type I
MSGTPPPTLRRLGERVDVRLGALLATERERWSSFDSDLARPIDEIARLVLAGGKRLRPAFCHWGYVGAGGGDDDQIDIDAGSALELMHAFALFHDDVMDDAATRRGQPTTHALSAAEHAAAGWAGESRRFGDGVAILVGDLAFVYADQLMEAAPVEAVRLWNELRIELNIGQYLDIVGSVQRERRIEKAERICRYKSGKYTIERPLHLGALLADPSRAGELLPQLSAYGLPLGDAFQMRDDVMGAFGDATATGKPVGGDLIEGKPTPLMARSPTPTPPSVPSSTSSAIPTCRPPTSRAFSRPSSTPAASTNSKRRSPNSPRAPSRRSKPPTSPPSRSRNSSRSPST